MVVTGIGAEGTGTEIHAGRAAPEVLEEATMIDVQVRTTFLLILDCVSHWEQRETGETIVTTIGGTLIGEMIVEETRGGMTVTATGTTLGMEMCPKIPKLNLLWV